jgi:glutathione synthase/RimK-type ligase-like ATP-grasp enzyme
MLGIAEQTFIDEQCRAAYWGAMLTGFKGKWVSTPEATLRASSKILQLSVARSAGFRVPNTIISQSRTEVLSFYEACRREVIVKSLAGNKSPILLTRRLDDPRIFEEEAYSACPAIYQEAIPGSRHMRLNCFGDRAFAAIIESKDLDWRPNLDVPVYSYEAPRDLLDKARLVLQLLGLEMGIFDLKETPEGEWVWLELNPQGQFLFLEPLTKLALAENFADFLIQCGGEDPRAFHGEDPVAPGMGDRFRTKTECAFPHTP